MIVVRLQIRGGGGTLYDVVLTASCSLCEHDCGSIPTARSQQLTSEGCRPMSVSSGRSLVATLAAATNS